EIGAVPFGPATLISKFTNRSPVIFGESDPIPCAVWQAEHDSPCSEMCVKCPPLPLVPGLKLVSDNTFVRSWHFAQSAYGPGFGPPALRSGFVKRFWTGLPGPLSGGLLPSATWLNS